MTVIYGTKQIATIGPRKVISITYPVPREELLGVPVALPTIDPAAPMIEFTVLTADMPTVSGIAADAPTYVAYVYVGGQNLVQTGQVVQFETWLNGVSTSGGAITPPALNNACFTLQFSTTVVLGDVVGVSLWDVTPDELQYDYIAMAVGATQPNGADESTLLIDAEYSDFIQMPTLTLGNPDYADALTTIASNGSNDLPMELYDGIIIKSFCVFNNLYRLTYGDRQVLLQAEDRNVRPFYRPMDVPTSITFYPTSIRVE